MEVTRKNFKESIPLISESIKRAEFLVIDTEFTGLIHGPDVSMFDSPAEYYLRTLSGCKDFLLIQYGLCCFYWDKESEQYMNDAYNFYVFPRGRPGPERTFLCQSSSLDFLSAQGFDFNKLIKEGIPYMTEPAETRLREMLIERQKLYANDNNTIPIPEENKQNIEDICKRVQQWLEEKKSDEMEIDRCNAFVRRLLFQELGARFKGEAYVETKVLENKNRVLKVTRVTPENVGLDLQAAKKEKEWEEFEEAVGFSKVARMISQSEKLVIGHNMLLDVLHTLNHFFQPLPPDYASFKEFAHCMFPSLLDTKYMASLPPFKDKVNSSVLQHLLLTLSDPPFGLPSVGAMMDRGYTLTDDKHHEAGYDAFITGLCFLAMRSHVSRMRGESETETSAALLRPFVNKLFLTKTAYQDSPYMNIDGPDPTPSRDHVFHLTFPIEWQRNDINQLFSPFGQILVQFIDDTSALVALSRREQARDVMRTLAKHSRTTLVPYVRFKQMVTQDTRHWRKEESITAPDTPRPRQAVSDTSVSPAAPQSPVKSELPKERTRSNSVTSSTPAPSRKRTSSGVFQVDGTEPPPKKAEVSRKRPELNGNNATDAKKEKQDSEKGQHDKISGGKGKGKQDKGTKGKGKGKHDKKVIERFDEEAKSQCVSAFQESDSWD